MNYYRLEQVDVSGERTHSNVVTAVYQWGRIHLDVYPNPTNGNLWLAMEMPAEGAATWKVLDASGRIVRAGRSSVGVGMNQVEIDLGGWTRAAMWWN
ncbi:MAG: T9SS type A sorting domain-containing protein [Flavobacteriales bacterium]|nr:T9SS type A sorting domain-containing protein [Flavobacteriales bacterium]